MPTPYTFKHVGALPFGGINAGASLAASAMLPLLAQINLLLTGAFGLGPLKADLVAQFKASIGISIGLSDPIAALKAAISASLQVVAQLRAALSIGLPSLSIQVSAALSLAAALQIKIGGINLLINLSLGIRLAGINFLAQLNLALSLGSCNFYAFFDTPMGTVQGTMATYPFAADGIASASHVTGIMIVAQQPALAAYSAFSFMFPIPPS